MKNTSNLCKSIYQGQNNLQQNIFPRKPLEELNMMDAFLFEAVTEEVENAKKIARIIIERATGHKVENLIVETQKQLKGINVDKRGIRMDIYTTEKDKEENGGRTLGVYDIEPNNYYEKDIPHRSRFYQSMIDSKLLPTNTPFDDLPDVITIWILPYDPFGEDRMLYTVKNCVVENAQIGYNDGILKIFLNTKGTKGGSKELKNLLTYMENTNEANAVDEDLAEIQEIVGNVKCNYELRGRYMGMFGVTDYEMRDSYEAGEKVGLQEGLIRGVINTCKSFGIARDKAKEELVKNRNLSDETAEEYLKLYW